MKSNKKYILLLYMGYIFLILFIIIDKEFPTNTKIILVLIGLMLIKYHLVFYKKENEREEVK